MPQLIDIDTLSPVERIALADVLYDSAMQEIEAMPLSDEQLAELDRRIVDIEQGKVGLVAWEQVRGTLGRVAMTGVLLHPAVRHDLQRAVASYNARAVGLGSAFMSDFERLIDRVVTFPLAYPETLGTYRRACLARFPYSVIYDDKSLLLVTVLPLRPDGVLHTVPSR